MNKKMLLLFILISSFSYAQEVKICSEERFLNLDPHLADSYPETQTFTGLVYESVVKYNPRNKALVPFLIERWTSFSQDKNYKLVFGKEIFFLSNKGGKKYKLEAEDFIFSLNLYLEKVKNGKIDDTYAKKNIQKIELSDDKTEVVISLVKADPFFMMRLADKMGLVLSRKYHEELKKKNKLVDFYKVPVGTGAFGIKKLHPSELELEVRPNYHFGKLAIANIKFVKTTDQSTSLKYVQSGLCDIAPHTRDSQKEKLNQYINPSELYVFLKINPRSHLLKLTRERDLWSFINFNSFAQAFNPEMKYIGQFLSGESALEKESHIDMVYSLASAKESIKKMRLKQVTIYFSEEAKQQVKSMKTFLRYLKTTFLDLGLDITLGEEKTADITLGVRNLNGMNEITLEDYYDIWPAGNSLDENWFTNLSRRLGKEAHIYPLGFIDTYHLANKQIGGFFSHRSRNFDLTLIKKE